MKLRAGSVSSLLAGAVLLLIPAANQAQTNVSGTISTNTTWTVAGSPYIVTGTLFVEGSGTPVLTIQAGATVKFNSGAKLLIGYNSTGGLQAVGTSSQPIVFTANTGSPTAGYWAGIHLWTNAASTSQITWATVSYGGISGVSGGIYVKDSSPTLSSVTCQNNAHSGVMLNNGAASISSSTVSASPVGLWIQGSYTGTVSLSTITSNTGAGIWVVAPASPSLTSDTISSNATYAISQDAGVTLGTVSGLTATGNGTNGVELRAGSTVQTSTTWKQVGIPYVVTGGTVYVEGGSTPVLTIEAGVTVKFSSGGKLLIGYNSSARLQAIGTSSQPIIFTANTGSPTAGYWAGIHLWTNAASTSQITWATVSYGGISGVSGGIYVNGSSPALSNVTCQNNAHSGVMLNGGAASITSSTVSASPVGLWIQGSYTGTVSSSTITSNTGAGIWVVAPASPSLTSDTISSNTTYAISQDAGVTLGTVSGLTATGNGTNGVELRAGSTVQTSTTWKQVGIPYVVTGGTVYVEGGSTPVLTIEAGVTVKFSSGGKLLIGYNSSARLQAIGTSSQPIVFTANTGSPTAGYWAGVHLWTNAASTSQITWATVSYGGIPGVSGGIYVNGSSPTLSNVTCQNNAHSGLTINGTSSAIINNSTFSNNGVGIWASAPATPSLNSSTISNNPSYAMSMEAGVSFGPATGVTASGNTVNAVEIRGTTASTSTTWRNFGIPYVATGDVTVQGAGGPVLTIEAGTTVKFNSGTTFYIGYSAAGGIQAVGTSAAPLLFTANTGSPPAGYWRGIVLGTGTVSTSKIWFATVSYGGVSGSWGGVYANGNSSALDHVRFVTNANSGLTLNNSTSLVSNCDFIGNPLGLVNLTPTSIVDARFNWWNSSTGPSTAGPGSGQSVSAGARFEPWLGAAGSAPQLIGSLTLGNSTFNPAISVNANFTFSTPLSGNWSLSILNNVGTTVRTITGSGTTASPSWDGKNDSAVDQPDGTYTYQVASTAGAQNAAPAIGRAYLDRTRQLTVTGVTQLPAYFSPNGDTIQDTTTLTATPSFDGAAWSVRVLNSGGTAIRTAAGAAGPGITWVWDGKNGSGTVQPDGTYTVELTVVDGTASSVSTKSATLDVVAPVASLTAPASGSTLSNIYQSGSTTVNVVGTGTDANLSNWIVDYGSGGAPTSWTTVGTGTSPVSASLFAGWQTSSLANGAYTLRLQVFDLAGNKSTVTRPETVGNLTVAQNVYEFNGGTGGTIQYTSTVPFSLMETLVVKNAGGQTVRTVFNGTCAVGTFNDIWNGRNDSGTLLPDGPYFYVATGSAGGFTGSWDLTSTYLNDSLSWYIDSWFYTPPPFMPFNNTPLPLTYNVSFPGRASMLFLPDISIIYPYSPNFATKALCNQPPNFCLPNDEYQPSGARTQLYVGLDPAGNFRPDIIGAVLMLDRATFPKNAAILFGTRPTISNLAISPAFFGPAGPPQTVAFDLATYQNQTATISTTFKNLSSQSVLRTITTAGQAPGHVVVSWDGKADSGAWCAAGSYAITVTATDGLGNAKSSQLLTTVSY